MLCLVSRNQLENGMDQCDGMKKRDVWLMIGKECFIQEGLPFLQNAGLPFPATTHLFFHSFPCVKSISPIYPQNQSLKFGALVGSISYKPGLNMIKKIFPPNHPISLHIYSEINSYFLVIQSIIYAPASALSRAVSSINYHEQFHPIDRATTSTERQGFERLTIVI